MTAHRLAWAGTALAALVLALPVHAGSSRSSQRVTGDADSWMTTWQSDGEKNFAYGVVDPDLEWTYVHGQESDYQAVQKLVKNPAAGSLLWVRMGSKRYRIDDAATIREAKSIIAPLAEISREQGRLGSLQGELGHEQGKIGHEQGKLGHEQGKIGAKQARIGAQQSAAALEDDDETEEALQRKQAQLNQEQEELGARQAQLGKHQVSMGAAQADMGRYQAELAAKQKELQPAVHAKLKALTKKAIEDGRAKRI
jgi:hypothetical protein